MTDLAPQACCNGPGQAYDVFARRWNTAQRMQRESREFHPYIEAQEEVLA
jgi:hypothetical protein